MHILHRRGHRVVSSICQAEKGLLFFLGRNFAKIFSIIDVTASGEGPPDSPFWMEDRGSRHGEERLLPPTSS